MVEIADLLGDHRIDCWALCKVVRERAGKKWPALPDYYDQLCQGLCRDKRGPLQSMTRLDDRRPYCVVGLTVGGRFLTHIGIILPDCESFVHLCPTRGVVVEKLESWAAHIKGYYEYD